MKQKTDPMVKTSRFEDKKPGSNSDAELYPLFGGSEGRRTKLKENISQILK